MFLGREITEGWPLRLLALLFKGDKRDKKRWHNTPTSRENLRPTGCVLTWNEHTHISVCHKGTRLLSEMHSVGFIIILFLFYLIIIILFIIVLFAFSCSIGIELLALPVPSKLSTTELQPRAKKLAMWTQEQRVLPWGAQGLLTSATGPTEPHRALTRLYFQESQLWVFWRVQSSLLAPAAGRVRVQLARSQTCGKTQCKGKRL